MKKLTVFFFCIFLTTKLVAKVNFIEVGTVETWEKMLLLAKETNTNILVHYVSEICPGCKDVRKNVFKNKRVSQFVSTHFLALRVYSFSEVGSALSEVYNLPNQGAILLLNNTETLFQSNFGAVDADTFLADAKKALALINRYPALQKGGAAGNLSKNDWVAFLLIEAQNNRVNAASPIVRDVASLLDTTDFYRTEVQYFILELGSAIDGPIFQTLKSFPESIATSDVFDWPTYFQSVFNDNMQIAIEKNDSILLEDYLFQMQQLPKEAQFFNMALKGRQLSCAAQNHWKPYEKITFAYLDPLPADSANAYQREAILLLENYPTNAAYKIVAELLKEGIDKRETYELYYTLGLFLYNQNDLLNAYNATYRAYKLAKNTDQQQLAIQFLKLIDSNY